MIKLTEDWTEKLPCLKHLWHMTGKGSIAKSMYNIWEMSEDTPV